jgi:hypothetical protein
MSGDFVAVRVATEGSATLHSATSSQRQRGFTAVLRMSGPTAVDPGYRSLGDGVEAARSSCSLTSICAWYAGFADRHARRVPGAQFERATDAP